MFEAARGLSPAQQASFLDQECAGEVEIRREIEAILGAAQGPTDQRLKKLAGPDRDNAYQDTVVERPMRLVPDATEVLERQTSTGPATTLQPKAGMHIYQYELIRELGSGGMGAVYLARDTKLGRRVAIKFLQHSNRALSERFLLEAQATARCSHENIVVIHDVKEHGGVPFMVLEYLQGSTLGDLIGDDRVPPSRAVQLVVPVVRALVCAHQHKIVHRDLKPPNIFMTDTGIIKVLDFGVAKVVHTMIGMTEAAVHTVGPAATFNAGEKRYHLRRCRGSTWQSGMEQGKPYGGVAEAGMVARSGRAGAAGSAAGYARAARRRWDGARADRAAAWGQGAENDEAAGMGPAAARERGQQRLRRGRYRGLARTSGPGRGGRGCRG